MAAASISSLFDRALTVFKRDPTIMIIVTLIYLGIFSIVGGATVAFGTLLVYGPLTAGYCLFMLKSIRGQRPTIVDLFLPLQENPVQIILAGALLSVFYFIGLILCVIPGIIVAFLYMFTFFYLVDMRMPAWDAMESSRRRISIDWGGWIGLFIVFVLLNAVGAMLCGIGTLITLPISTLMLASAYDERHGAMPEDRNYDDVM